MISGHKSFGQAQLLAKYPTSQPPHLHLLKFSSITYQHFYQHSLEYIQAEATSNICIRKQAPAKNTHGRCVGVGIGCQRIHWPQPLFPLTSCVPWLHSYLLRACSCWCGATGGMRMRRCSETVSIAASTTSTYTRDTRIFVALAF
jgi:hypothetical protein